MNQAVGSVASSSKIISARYAIHSYVHENKSRTMHMLPSLNFQTEAIAKWLYAIVSFPRSASPIMTEARVVAGVALMLDQSAVASILLYYLCLSGHSEHTHEEAFQSKYRDERDLSSKLRTLKSGSLDPGYISRFLTHPIPPASGLGTGLSLLGYRAVPHWRLT